MQCYKGEKFLFLISSFMGRQIAFLLLFFRCRPGGGQKEGERRIRKNLDGEISNELERVHAFDFSRVLMGMTKLYGCVFSYFSRRESRGDADGDVVPLSVPVAPVVGVGPAGGGPGNMRKRERLTIYTRK